MKAFTYLDAVPRRSVRGRLTAACFTASSFALVLSATAAPAAEPTPAYKVLHSFQLADGVFPFNALMKDGKGNFYGTTLAAGPNGAGTVYNLTAKGAYSVLYGFSDSGTDAQNPVSDPSLVKDASGNLYGTAGSGGQSGNGAIFKVAPDGTETVLYSFTGNNDGGAPNGGVLLNRKGDIFGTTTFGGTYGAGTFYVLTASGTFKVIHAFGGGGSDGAVPVEGLYKDPNGNFWGTTSAGGASGNGGTVFKITPKGVESVVYSFTGGNDGGTPESTLIADKQGNLYGTARSGGLDGGGVVFEIAPGGAEKTLYTFTGANDGYYPVGGLVMDTSGNLYGQTFGSGVTGACTGSSCGSVYELTPAGTEITLHDFTGGSDGQFPQEGLLLNGPYLYGTTQAGGGTGCGGSGCGTVFRVPK